MFKNIKILKCSKHRRAILLTKKSEAASSTMDGLALLGLNALATARGPGSYRGGDYDDDEMLVSLVEETRVPGGNH